MKPLDTKPHSDGSSIKEVQRILAEIYLAKDSKRGLDGTFMYLVSEVGELAEALRDGVGVEKEFADVFAWLLSVANIAEIDLEDCMKKFYLKCPDCQSNPCACNSKP